MSPGLLRVFPVLDVAYYTFIVLQQLLSGKDIFWRQIEKNRTLLIKDIRI